MRILWRDPARYMSVRQVREALDAGLAYTTVMTLLSRLHDKGFLERRLDGRAWTYRPVVSEAVHRAQTMSDALHGSDDHADVLFHFVEQLAPEDVRELRRRLGDGERQ
jgi:predicted transcriptional regulator